MSKPDPAVDRILERIEEFETWINTPQLHLNDQPRRKLLEAMLVTEVQRVRDEAKAAQRRKGFSERGKELLLVAAVITVVAPIILRILTALGVEVSW